MKIDITDNIVFKNTNAIILWFGVEYLVEFNNGDYKWFAELDDAIDYASGNLRG